MLQGAGDTQTRSKLLRQEMSLPEILLWRALRERPGGFKFRKSHPSGPYTADFYCHAARLIIEVDGEAHNRGSRPARDVARDRWFAVRGLDTLRIPASLILADLSAAVLAITAAAERCTAAST